MAKPRFTIEQHRQYGAMLKRMQQDLLDLEVELSSAFPHDIPATKTAAKVSKAIQDLRCEMENELFKLDPDAPLSIYYGGRDEC